jgi:hypothetical protein
MSSSSLRPRPWRAWWACLLTVLVLLTGLPRETLALEGVRDDAARTGAGAARGDERSADEQRSVHQRSVDAPITSGRLELPHLPVDFETRDGGWIHLAYPKELSHWVTPLLDEAITFRELARARLGADVRKKVHVRLGADPAQMAELAPIDAPYPKYAVGVAYSRAGLVLLTEEPLHPASDHDLLAVLRHELAHVALHDAVGGRHVPLWFNEGVAIHLARENAFARTRTLWTATVSGNLISLRDLDQRFPSDIVGTPLAYAQSADVVRFLLRQQDEERFSLLVRRVARGQSFDRALYDSYGLDLYGLELQWQQDVNSRYSLWPILLSGSMVWAGAVVLVVVAWRRNRRRMRITLARWAREEAREDARLRLLRELQATKASAEQPQAALPASSSQSTRSTVDAPPTELMVPPSARRDSPVPQVEHDGRWHTLH